MRPRGRPALLPIACASCALLAVGAQADDDPLAPVTLDSDLEREDLSGAARYLIDESGSLTLAEVSAPDAAWSRARPPTVFGGAVWLKARLVPARGAWPRVWLTAGDAFVDDVTVWTSCPPGRSPARARSGQMVPLAERDLATRDPTVRVALDPGGCEVHVRLASESAINPALVVRSPEAGARHHDQVTFGRGFIYGAIFLMGLYALLVAAATRDRATLYLGLYTLLIDVWLAWMSGDLALLLGPGVFLAPRLGVHLTLLGAQLLAIAFCRALLDTRTHLPRADRVLQGLFAIVLVDMALGFVAPWKVVSSIILPLGPALYLTYAVVGVLRFRQGSRPAGLYAAAWVITVVLLVVGSLSFGGALAGGLAEHTMHIAFFVDVLFLAAALSERAREDGARIRRLHEASGRFVPREFLSILGKKELPEVRWGDQTEREMTVYFSDIRSFTQLVEGMSPEDTIGFVNAYLAAMEPPIAAAGGFIDKYIGDAVMALFETADAAVAGAIDGLAALEEHNRARVARGQPAIKIGIGLHTGPLMLGTVGSVRRISCTVLGDSVNLASRVESLTKRYGAALLITEATRARLEDPDALSLRLVDRVAVKGKTEPVTLYEVLDPLPPETRTAREDTRQYLDQVVAFLTAGDLDAARAPLDAARARDPDDPTLALYLERIDTFTAHGLPEGWDGVVRLDAK